MNARSVILALAMAVTPATGAAWAGSDVATSQPAGLAAADLKPGQWVKLSAVLTDSTKDAGLSSRSWNNLRYDPQAGRFYVWEGWCCRHSDPKYGFPYTLRRYHIYSDALYSFAVPTPAPDGRLALDLEAVSCWQWASGQPWTLRDPAKDHPRMRTPSPKDRHPFNSTSFDTRRKGLWQFGGVNTGGGIGWLSDLWFYDIAKGQWKELHPTKVPRVGGAAATVYLPEQDALFALVQAPDELAVWKYDIAANQWTQITGHRARYRLSWDTVAVVYDSKRKKCHFFSTLTGGEKGPDGKPAGVLHRFSYDPADDRIEDIGPVAAPEGFALELTLDGRRDRIVCLKPSGPDKAPMELWTCDLGGNRFVRLQPGGTPPPRQSGAPRTLGWDEGNDLYVVWRGGAVYILRPDDNGGQHP